MRKALILLIALLPLGLAAQTRRLTIDDIFDAKAKISFGGHPVTGLEWLDDTHFLQPKTAEPGEVESLSVIDARTGKAVALFDSALLEHDIAAIDGVKPEDAKKLARPPEPNLSTSHDRMILTIAGDLWLYDLNTRKLKRLTSKSGEEEEAGFSPDGSMVAFVRGNDLYVVDTATATERKLTSDGSTDVLNGKLDWVYQEEIYGRGLFRAYWWSPDSKTLAYLRLGEQPVPTFTVVDHLPIHQELEVTRYPKPGDPNPTASLNFVSAKGGPSNRIGASAGPDTLVVNVSWRPDSARVVFQLQDREQTWLDLISADRKDGTSTRLLRETTKAWVQPQGSTQFLHDGSFLWLSERNGYKHIYRVGADGKQTQLTRGEWEVRTLHGVDEKDGWIYFSGTERSPIGSDVYRCRLDGSKMQRISESAGTHSAKFNKAMTLYLDSWSDINTPSQTTLRRPDGKLLRVIDANPVAVLAEFALAKPEFMQVRTRDGFVMEAMMFRPPDFDPSKRYPVFQQTYAGPHAQSVVNRWGGAGAMWFQFLAQ